MKRTIPILALFALFAWLLPGLAGATALTAGFSAPALAGERPVAEFTILAAEIVYAGGIVAVDYTDEAQMASDTQGLRVVGRAAKIVDNTADGKTCAVESGIFRYNNSTTYPVPRSAIGQACYVEDDNTVAGWSTNLVSAGLVRDVDSDGVWVDMRPQALARANAARPDTFVAKTDNYTATAAICFDGRTAFRMTKSGGLTLTLPAAVAGMRVGVMRGSVTASDDVFVQCATGDKIQGFDAISAASKKVENTVDAISGIIWFRAVDDTVWAIDNPLPADVTSWVKNDT
jgi:hypothetical protein